MSGDDIKIGNVDADNVQVEVPDDVASVDSFFFDHVSGQGDTAKAEARRADANFRGRYDGGVADWNIGGNGGGGSITAGLAKQIEKEKEATDDFESGLEAAREIHRTMTQTEWEHTRFDFAGMDMDGADIDSLMSYMKDPAVRQRLIEKRAKEKGITTEQANKEYDIALRYGELFEKVKRGTATEAEKAEFQTLDTPQTREIIQSAAQQKNEDMPNPDAVAQVSQTATNEAVSMEARDARFERPFPSAPNATESFVQANLATEPLDVPRQPVQVASVTMPPPQQARVLENSGFGV